MESWTSSYPTSSKNSILVNEKPSTSPKRNILVPISPTTHIFYLAAKTYSTKPTISTTSSTSHWCLTASTGCKWSRTAKSTNSAQCNTLSFWKPSRWATPPTESTSNCSSSTNPSTIQIHYYRQSNKHLEPILAPLSPTPTLPSKTTSMSISLRKTRWRLTRCSTSLPRHSLELSTPPDMKCCIPTPTLRPWSKLSKFWIWRWCWALGARC